MSWTRMTLEAEKTRNRQRLIDEQNGSFAVATSRLRNDYIQIKSDPVPYVSAEPLPSNILEWHFVLEGPKKTPYEGGYYHGKISFPSSFPFAPPAIYMITPNGRFKTETKLCLSFSDYHPETWNPAWTVSTLLTGLLSFMLDSDSDSGRKHQLAGKSLEFNLNNKQFCGMFPELAIRIQEILQSKKTGKIAS